MFNILNLKPNKVSTNLSSYTSMVYGNAKAGKSTLAFNLFKEEGLFLGFEDGTRALAGAYAIPVTSWEDLTRDRKVENPETNETVKVPSINKQLKTDEVKAKFKVLIIDTVDLMYDAATKYICEKEDVEDILDIPYGKGLKLVDDLFREQLLSWEREGYKLFFISHSEDRKLEIKDHKGIVREISKYQPSLHKRAFKIVSKMVDNIFFAYVKIHEDQTERRVVFTRETNNYFAGSRFKHLPEELPLDAESIQKAIVEAIEKEELTTSKVTTNAALTVENNFETFEDVKEKVVKLVKSKFTKNMDIVSEITVKQLGQGAKITSATEEDIDALDVIYDYLTNKAKELNL